MTAALASHEPFEVDFRVGWADERVRWILVRGVGRYLHYGSLTRVLGFTLDITARKESELEQREIAESEKRAREESDRVAVAMDHFVTTVSHASVLPSERDSVVVQSAPANCRPRTCDTRRQRDQPQRSSACPHGRRSAR